MTGFAAEYKAALPLAQLTGNRRSHKALVQRSAVVPGGGGRRGSNKAPNFCRVSSNEGLAVTLLFLE
ncbi:hypothetical protein NDU88_002402 [Pleurodeles waltl]|uniref:Uncharacterized protein n=1 Tax=Pleurodeles waltl TaxID=8319 RepID=A0AAV7QCJ2_PLEWA|nr:hypothetical protein NDU88_002402 [Pleurodeles waltl]